MEIARWGSPLGTIILGATSKGLAGLWFDGQRHQPDMRGWPENPGHPVLQQAIAQLQEYFDGTRTRFDLPLDLGLGTSFQQSVWNALLAIPCGDTSSYSLIGQRIGKPAASRAVGAAIGRNPLSIVVPCHRVLGSGGQLTGYAGGLDRKTALLKLERALM
ncbi:methylated-DNA--[protein]-cysteine S-methyltransferase [Ramlibacter albus]|uniref:Methylated-DNA--protein-cysteine methyltransferase n=1 Tax=Ramlibacter albus TaxID=2079448 RepID=A0A923S3I8_9BURK|nr:methylated-DNA--[protein]-cysteine S-methyltransferase [Ramlibacter albus]MBC5765878.1 methylated-DNA--[protein]-cysteine S-methyltransferase [Ramlibacter albus]